MNYFRTLFTTVSLAIIVLAIPSFAIAQSASGLTGATSSGTSGATGSTDFFDSGAAAGATGIGTASPLEIGGALVSFLLQIIALLFMVIVIYSGYKWMVAGGNSTQVEESKSRIKWATIGLAMILASYSITLFIFSNLEDATGFDAPASQPAADEGAQ